MEVKRKVQYENELDHSFPQWITEMPGGENIKECIQCGTCSSICPMSIYMDNTPRKIIAMTDAGFKNEVLSSFTIWLCASCYSCMVNCPKQIKITDIMYAFKRRAIEEKIYPHPKFAIPILAGAFAGTIKKYGRITESWLVVKLALKTGLLNLLKVMPLGFDLMRTGRYIEKITPEAIALLESYNWPGNVRELENVIERAVILCGSGHIAPSDLPIDIRSQTRRSETYLDEQTLYTVEKEHLLKTLEKLDGNKTLSAKTLGITKKTLYSKLRKYGLI